MILKTYMGWKESGRHVRRGCHGIKIDGQTLFSYDQTSDCGVHDCDVKKPIDLRIDPPGPFVDEEEIADYLC